LKILKYNLKKKKKKKKEIRKEKIEEKKEKKKNKKNGGGQGLHSVWFDIDVGSLLASLLIKDLVCLVLP
jgi:hypothetical protein